MKIVFTGPILLLQLLIKKLKKVDGEWRTLPFVSVYDLFIVTSHESGWATQPEPDPFFSLPPSALSFLSLSFQNCFYFGSFRFGSGSKIQSINHRFLSPLPPFDISFRGSVVFEFFSLPFSAMAIVAAAVIVPLGLLFFFSGLVVNLVQVIKSFLFCTSFV